MNGHKPFVSLGVSCLAVFWFGLQAAEFLLIPSAALLGLWVAYVPDGAVRAYNGLGDYSYGLYIWHYPVEQVMRTQFESVSAWQLFLISLPVVLPLVICSWHFVERPCLMRVRSISEKIKGWRLVQTRRA